MAPSEQVAKAAEKPAVFVVNACTARAPEVAETREILDSYHLPLAPLVIGDRRAFASAVATGRVFTEFDPEGKADEKITKLLKWIRQHIGEKHGH
jgi:chromosome partitioning protein